MGLFSDVKENFSNTQIYDVIKEGFSVGKNTNVVVNISNSGEKYVLLTIKENTLDGSTNSIYHKFSKNQFDVFFKQVKDCATKFNENLVSKEYPEDCMEDLIKAIFNNFVNYKDEHKAIPKPKINIYLEGGKLIFTVVDFKNNAIMFNNEISLEELIAFIKIETDEFNKDNIYGLVLKAIVTEFYLFTLYHNTNFDYLGEENLSKIKQSGNDCIIRNYVLKNTVIEEIAIKYLILRCCSSNYKEEIKDEK